MVWVCHLPNLPFAEGVKVFNGLPVNPHVEWAFLGVGPFFGMLPWAAGFRWGAYLAEMVRLGLMAILCRASATSPQTPAAWRRFEMRVSLAGLQRPLSGCP